MKKIILNFSDVSEYDDDFEIVSMGDMSQEHIDKIRFDGFSDIGPFIRVSSKVFPNEFLYIGFFNYYP